MQYNYPIELNKRTFKAADRIENGDLSQPLLFLNVITISQGAYGHELLRKVWKLVG